MLNKSLIKIGNYFKFNKLNTTFKKEILGGFVTAISMLYILSVEPNILQNSPSVDKTHNMAYGGIFLATVITTFLGSFIMGFVSNMPIGLAPGMGVNAIFTYNIASSSSGVGYEGALIAVMFSSILLTIISVTKIRFYILQSITLNMRKIIAIGVGFFIAYIGFENIGFIKTNSSGLPIASLSSLKENYLLILVGIFSFCLILFFHSKKIPGGIILGILIALVVSLILGNTLSDQNLANHFAKWHGWKYNSLNGFSGNLKSTFDQFTKSTIWIKPTLYIGIFILAFVSFFDATGTLYSIGIEIGDIHNRKFKMKPKYLIGDAVGGLVNGFVGTSNSTSFIESSLGAAEGAQTGFSSLVIGAVFLLAVPLFPLFTLITPAITGGALIFVGAMMIKQLKDIDWQYPEYLFSGFACIIITIITFSITNGIILAFLIFSVVCLIEKKWEKLNTVALLLDIFFIGYFVAFAFIQ